MIESSNAMADTVEQADVSGLADGSGHSMYLDVAGVPAYTVLHSPAPSYERETAVLFCPPFGFDEVCTYRILREWALRLARTGHHAMRLTYPGCGDSGGTPRDPGRLDAWTDAVSVAAATLRQRSGVRSVVAIGLGLGGLLAYRSASDASAIDGLVLWGVPGRGRDLTRQLKAFSRMESTEFFKGLPKPPPLAEGDLEGGGFLLTGDTVRDLAGLDLTALELPGGLPRGALLLERDGIAVDARLRDSLEARGVAVTVAVGDGYGAMTAQPHDSVVPAAAVATVASWLERVSEDIEHAHPNAAGTANPRSAKGLEPPAGHPPGAPEAEIQLPAGGTAIERPVDVQISGLRLSGMLTVPAATVRDGLGVLFLHSGAVRRIGPNRIWVEASRAWASWGVASLRLDVEGIGDSDGEVSPYAEVGPLHDPKFLAQITAGLDLLEVQTSSERLAIVGLCSGAYWALHGALADPRVSGCMLVNPRAFVYHDALSAARDVRRALAEPLTLERVRRNVTRARALDALRLLASLPGRRLRRLRSGSDRFDYQTQLDRLLMSVQESGKQVTLVFGEREPLDEELTSSGQLDLMKTWPTFVLARVAVRDHTLRPIWAQQQVLEQLGRSLCDRFRLDHAPAA